MNLDDELRSALRRVDAPAAFHERVMGKVAGVPPRRRQHGWILRIAASAILVSLLAVSGYRFTEAERERRDGEAAKAQLMLALRITADKTQIARTALDPSHVH